MSYGKVYVPVYARTLDNSSNGLDSSSTGSNQGGFYIHWISDTGIINHDWTTLKTYIADTGWYSFNNDLADDYKEDNYYTFENWVMNESPSNLDGVLGAWDPNSKLNYVIEFGNFLGTNYPNGGCIEAL